MHTQKFNSGIIVNSLINYTFKHQFNASCFVYEVLIITVRTIKDHWKERFNCNRRGSPAMWMQAGKNAAREKKHIVT